MKKLKKDELFSLEEDKVESVPFGNLTQKPGNIETSTTRELLGGNSVFPILSNTGMNLGVMRYDTPHLKKHKANTFIVSIFPVTLQSAFKDLFAEKFPQYAEDGHGSVIFKGSTYSENVFYNKIETLTSVSQFPDILITTDVNSLYHRTSRLLNDRNFETFQRSLHSIYTGTKISHPSKVFGFLAAEAMVMVIDKSKYGTIQPPREWYELLNPALQDSIVFCGDRDYHCNTFFLYFVKEYGYGAISQLRKNTLRRIHPEEMLRSIDSGNKMNAAIYVMPYSYAKNIQNNFDYEVIWPNDGAILLPIQMLVKKGAVEKNRDVIRFLMGEEVGKMFEKYGLVATNSKVKNELPSNKLNWIGWSFLKNTELYAMKTKIRELL
jgi:ABC-type Fe3+ transport system substrate-binding protein